jgi:hypothetical protein
VRGRQSKSLGKRIDSWVYGEQAPHAPLASSPELSPTRWIADQSQQGLG